MGTFSDEVVNYFKTNSEEEEILKPFLQGFNITRGCKRKEFSTCVSEYFLEPEDHMKEAFGFSKEVLLIYARYDTMEPRTLQTAEAIITSFPAKGRVETLNYFLVSNYDNVREWVDLYFNKDESRIVITFSAKELWKNRNDSWFIQNRISQQFYYRDLFDFTLPLKENTYFFGRQHILAHYFDAIKRSENRGIFGLRKTGKTSLLYKLERMILSENTGYIFFYDCKSPSIRKQRWNTLIEKICIEISEKTGVTCKRRFDEVKVADTFINLINRIREFQPDKKIILVFDEIEFISFKAIQDKHWHNDFIDFWQTIWTCQSRNKNLVIIVAGVNPTVVEIDSLNGVQNPLFGIVSYEYLRGLEFEEMKELVSTLGSRIGLKFDDEALRYLYARYGGHPLLTRKACSWINKQASINKLQKPINITLDKMRNEEEERDIDLTFYCGHVVSEIQQFYKDEYDMLELLSSGQVRAFVELSTLPEYTKHLKDYGLLSIDQNQKPVISIPVIGRYIGLELARRENRKTIYKIIDKNNRRTWLDKHKSYIIDDFRLLEKLIKSKQLPLLFGFNSFPEADKFFNIPICDLQENFENFINTCNRCFVESIENYGSHINKRNYLYNEIKSNYPNLFLALKKIKIYRHYSFHIMLNSQVNQDLLDFLNRDLEGRSPSQVPELFFVLQQCVMDELLSSLQLEINQLS
jgi:hypothetical protein